MELSKFGWLKNISYPTVKTFVQNNWKTVGGVAGLIIGGGVWAWPGGTAPHISAFMATPSEMANVAEGVTLQWDAEEATEVRLNGVLMDHPNGKIQAFPDVSTTYVLVASNQHGIDKRVIQVATKDPNPPTLTILPENINNLPSRPELRDPVKPADLQPEIVINNGPNSTTREVIQKAIARFSQIPWEQEGKSKSQVQDAKNECVFAFRQSPGTRSMEECMIARNYKRRR